MKIIFEVIDKNRKNVRLTEERWKHITQEHPSLSNPLDLKAALLKPQFTSPSIYDPENVIYFYQFQKEYKRYLFVAVKYLNGDGFIIIAYYTRKPQ